MTRTLIAVPADNTTRLLALLRLALSAEGDAVMPVPGSGLSGSYRAGWPW